MIRAVLSALLAVACGGEPPVESAASSESSSVAAAEADPPEEREQAETTDEPEAPPEVEEAPLDFEAALPEEPCAETALIAAHSEVSLPGRWSHALAIRRDGGRRYTVALSDVAIERDDLGRFVALEEGHARLEMDAIRRRRHGTLEPGRLGLPDSRRQSLTHVRIVRAHGAITFGVREIGSVEITAVEEARVCGRVELSDGFTQVRGVFAAEVVDEP